MINFVLIHEDNVCDENIMNYATRSSYIEFNSNNSNENLDKETLFSKSQILCKSKKFVINKIDILNTCQFSSKFDAH